jgi:hypothetical protein
MTSVASSHSRSERASAPSRLACSPGALEFDGFPVRSAVTPIALGVLLGQLRGLLKRFGDPQVQPGQLQPSVPAAQRS